MLRLGSVLFLVALFACTLTNCTQSQSAKSVSELDEKEKGALNALIKGAYKKAGEGKACFLYETSYYSVPQPDGSVGEKLETPIVLFS